MGGIGRFAFGADDNRVLVRCGLFQCRELAGPRAPGGPADDCEERAAEWEAKRRRKRRLCSLLPITTDRFASVRPPS
jgi:hypothetical protein